MRFACLGSGSEGNGLLVEADGTYLLVDCGFAVNDTVARLERLAVAPDAVAAIVVTHEHSDHIGGVAAFAGAVGSAPSMASVAVCWQAPWCSWWH